MGGNEIRIEWWKDFGGIDGGKKQSLWRYREVEFGGICGITGVF
jgi:hypothetical protein